MLIAGIDNALNMLENDRDELFKSFYNRYSYMMEKLSNCKKLRFLPMGSEQDIGKLVISGKEAGISGQKIYDLLLRKYHLQLEMASSSYCLAMFTVCDNEEAYVRMTKALLEIDSELAKGSDQIIFGSIDVTGLLTYADRDSIQLWKAWNMECELIPLSEASGRYAGEFINHYPPGIPLLVPGERFTEKHCSAIKMFMSQGLNVQGVLKSALRGEEQDRKQDKKQGEQGAQDSGTSRECLVQVIAGTENICD